MDPSGVLTRSDPSMKILTLTLNPVIDGACETDAVRHTHKVRTEHERYDPGGGGINVARVIGRLGGDVEALYLAGGATGAVLDELLDRNGVRRRRVNIADHTRISLAVHERASGREYRFVPEGPQVSEAEWQDCLEAIEQSPCDWLVASGSLPRGIPRDFYARVGAIAGKNNTRFVLDSSGDALRLGLAGGGIFLVKPSRGELERLAGQTLPDGDALLAAARGIVERGEAIHVAVSMGHEGALLVNASGALQLPAIPVEVRSAVGAGDSFLAAMVNAIAAGWEPEDAFRFGIAAGTAAVMTPGTDLCHRADVERLFRQIAGRQPARMDLS